MKKILLTLILSLALVLPLASCDAITSLFAPNIGGVTFSDSEFVYDGEEKSISVSGELPRGITVEYVGNGAVNAGEYEVVAKFYKNGEYIADSDLCAKMVIKKATYDTSDFGFEGKTVFYDKEPHSIELDESRLPEGVKVSYRGNGVTEVGEHRIVAVFTVTDKNYESIQPITATLRIELNGYDSEGLIYSELASGALEVIGYSGSSSLVYIPESFEGKKITSIGTEAFSGLGSVEEIYMADSVIKIKNKAFFGSGLVEIRLSKAITTIGEEAFASTSVKKITLPDSLISLGQGILSNTPLEEIKLPFIGGSHETTNSHFGYIFGAPSYTVTGEYVPATLKRVTVSGACKKIPAYSFMGCENIESVVIESGALSIGNAAFSGCVGLKSVYIPRTISKIPADAHYYDSPFFGASEALLLVFGGNSSVGYGQYFSNISRDKQAETIYSKTLDEYYYISERY